MEVLFDNENDTLPKYIYKPPEDYSIGILVQPCGMNLTSNPRNSEDGYYETLGYDCCMDRFGMGEYGYIKQEIVERYNDESLLGSRIPGFRQLAHHDEISNNIDLVNEDGSFLDEKFSRRSDDETFVDYSCVDEREPFLHCIAPSMGARRSILMSPCWDNNQTIDASKTCYDPTGIKQRIPCMQIAYTQSAMIITCGGDYKNNTECGTFIEIHRRNGSPYDAEEKVLSETKITTPFTNGMTTLTIPPTYDENNSRINFSDEVTDSSAAGLLSHRRTLCAYHETKVRVGSMVVINDNASKCCCPSSYSQRTKLGSFFCPRVKNSKHGPFAQSIIPDETTVWNLIQNDYELHKYPFCQNNAVMINSEETNNTAKDVLMCSQQSQTSTELICEGNAGIICKERGAYYTRPCKAISPQHSDGSGVEYSSEDLQGTYSQPCPMGDAFQPCGQHDKNEATTSSSSTCPGSDTMYTFANELGKVTTVPVSVDGTYGITFNNGRTSYNFTRDQFDLIIPDSNYELWWVQRHGGRDASSSPDRKVFQKKSFRVTYPPCTYDYSNEQMLPYAIWDKNGNLISVLEEEYNGTVLPSFS